MWITEGRKGYMCVLWIDWLEKSTLRRWPMSEDEKEVIECTLWTCEGRVFQADNREIA